MSRITAAPLIFGAAVVVAAEFVVIGLIPALTGAFDISPARAGWLITAFALASALFGPLLTAATARFPVTPVLALALLPFAANLLLLAYPSFALALTLRVLQGATLPLFMSVAGALIGLERGAGPGIALLYIGVTVGGTLAPPAGSFVAAYLGWQAPMALIGALALLGTMLCLKRVPWTYADTAVAPWRLLARARIQSHLLLSTLAFSAMFTGFSYIAILLSRAALTPEGITLALLGFGAAGLAGNWIAGRLESFVLAGTVVAALLTTAMAGMISADMSVFATGVAILFWGAAHAAGFVFCQVRVMQAAPDAPGFAGSLNISAANIGIAIGSIAGGRALEQGGTRGIAIAAGILALLAIAAAGACRSRNVMQPSSYRNRSDTDIAPE